MSGGELYQDKVVKSESAASLVLITDTQTYTDFLCPGCHLFNIVLELFRCGYLWQQNLVLRANNRLVGKVPVQLCKLLTSSANSSLSLFLFFTSVVTVFKQSSKRTLGEKK